MEFIPHNYQKRAIDFLLEKPKCALMLGLGMGKTVITLKALCDFTSKKIFFSSP